MVQVQKHHLLPISLCFGYIPILILLPSVSYNRGKRFDDVSDKDSYQNGLLFLEFFPLYFVCILFIAFHILTIFYMNTWTAVLLNGVGSLMNLCVGLALGSVLDLYHDNLYYPYLFRELKAVLAGVIFLMFTQIIGYSSWPGFAKVKRKFLQPTQPLSQPQQLWYGGLQTSYNSTKVAVLILIVSIVIGNIGLLCHTGGTIAYTVAAKDFIKDWEDDDVFMFSLVSLYMVVGLYVLLIPLLILTIVIPHEKYPWISYLIFVGKSLFNGLDYVTSFSQTIADFDSTDKKIFHSMISVSVGSAVLALSTVVYACCWSLKFWLNAAPSTSAETIQQSERDNEDDDDEKLLRH